MPALSIASETLSIFIDVSSSVFDSHSEMAEEQLCSTAVNAVSAVTDNNVPR
jgi:hypothetical protein